MSCGAPGWTALDCLLADALSINENLKYTLTTFFAVIGGYYADRMRRIDRQIERETISFRVARSGPRTDLLIC
jgi:hypothetical protein